MRLVMVPSGFENRVVVHGNIFTVNVQPLSMTAALNSTPLSP